MKSTAIQTHTNIEELFFPVEKHPTTEFFFQSNFADHLSHCIHLPRQNKVVQICSDTYELVPNKALLEPIYLRMLELFGKDGFDTEVRSYDDRKFYVKMVIKDKVFNIIKGDDICPVIEITNSYDGTVKQRIALGYYRLICKNGLMAFTESFKSSLKHSTRSKSLELNPIFNQLDQVETQLKRFKKLTDRQVLPDELTQIITTIRKSNTIKYPQKLIPSAPLIAEKESLQLGTDLSAWLLYNGFNNALYHSSGKLLPEERERIDRRVLQVIEKELSL